VSVFSFIFQRFQLHCWSVAVTNLKCETYNIPYYYILYYYSILCQYHILIFTKMLFECDVTDVSII
jgi:hypothetical protein